MSINSHPPTFELMGLCSSTPTDTPVHPVYEAILPVYPAAKGDPLYHWRKVSPCEYQKRRDLENGGWRLYCDERGIFNFQDICPTTGTKVEQPYELWYHVGEQDHSFPKVF